jgi:hypothetical protein
VPGRSRPGTGFFGPVERTAPSAALRNDDAGGAGLSGVRDDAP